jgi:Flp pilus assembly protein TadB
MAGSSDRRDGPDADRRLRITAADPVVPFRIRVGIKGHHSIEDEVEVAVVIREVLEKIRSLIPGTSRTAVHLTLISPLAEGADRIGAHAVVKIEGAHLEVPLPFPQDDYSEDFATDGSRNEFRDLLAGAECTLTREPVKDEDRPDGYQAVGRYVADRSDALIAVWDGEPARGRDGTAEIVSRAVRNEIPVFWIPSRSPHDWGVLGKPATNADGELEFARPPAVLPPQSSAELRSCVARLEREWQVVDSYNDQARDPLGPSIEEHDAPEIAWATAARNAADALANKNQRGYRASLRLTFLFAALALIAITAQTVFDLPALVGLIDLGAILVIGLVVIQSGRARQQERYLGYRFLAERLREAPFLALVGIDQVQPTAFAPEFAGYPSEGWPWRVFDEIWSLRPRCSLEELDVPTVRGWLADEWISDQLAHHAKTYTREKAAQEQTERWVKSLFVATAVAAFAHFLLELFGDWGGAGWTPPNVMVFVSISLAAIGAALAGFGSQRGYRRYAANARQMQNFLQHDLERMRAAKTPSVVRRVAEDTHRHMLAENRTWFRDLLFEEIELHT